MPIGHDNYEPAYSAGVRADASEKPEPTDDGSYVSRSATLAERRSRRLYTFRTPLRIRAEVQYDAQHPLQAPADLFVLWAEGIEEDSDEAACFLVLDVLGTPAEGGGVCWPDPVVGIWVHADNIASAQVQTPLRDKPGAPRAITDLAKQCDRYMAHGRCELRLGHRGSHQCGQTSWGGL